MATHFSSVDEKLKAYLKFRRLSLSDSTFTQLLNCELEYLQIEVEARQLQHVLLCWISRGEIPTTTKEYRKILKKYRDQTILKILGERDQIVSYEKAKIVAEGERQKKREQALKEEDSTEIVDRKTGSQLPVGQPVDPESLREALAISETLLAEEHFLSTLCERRAEISVCRNLLEMSLMSLAVSRLRDEHASLLSVFHHIGTEQAIQAFIHPSQ